MKSPEVVRAKLATRLDADCSDQRVKNNKMHYHFKFENSVGWKWVEQQVYEAAEDVDIDLELWRVNTSGVANFEIEIRELVRRKNVTDENQHGLADFT